MATDWKSLAMAYWRELAYARALAKRLRDDGVELDAGSKVLLDEIAVPDFDQGCIAYLAVNREDLAKAIADDFAPGGLFEQLAADARANN